MKNIVVLYAMLVYMGSSYGMIANDWTAYTCMNNTFGKLNLSTGVATAGSCAPNYWDLDFAPDGTLYGLSRSADALYRIVDPERGLVQKLVSLPGDSGGDPIALSPDGKFIYFTVGIDATPRTLYKYDLAASRTTTLGVIQAPKAFTGLQFTPDGTLYAIDGYNGTNGTKHLWTINLKTLTATSVGPERFGLAQMSAGGTARSLELAPDGTMYLLITPEAYSWPSNPHPEQYVGTIDLGTGLATIHQDCQITGFDHCDTIAIIVPEPGTMGLVAVGALMLRKRAKGKRD
ncbi:MAG: hypothetical protein LLF76_10140 [Planctomycetaceae bacterium]|nr:hypothetical protein [Planctomycetaceae bacterium]